MGWKRMSGIIIFIADYSLSKLCCIANSPIHFDTTVTVS